MKQLVITAFLVLSGLGAQAQTGETRKSSEFSTLEVKNGVQVVFTQSEDTSIKVESDNKTNLENIITEFSKGTLKVYLRELENNKNMYGSAKVYISAPNVNLFKLSTGASVKAEGKVTGEEITIKLSSGASFTGETKCSKKCIVKAESGSMFRGLIATEDFEAKATSGATIKISGTAANSTVVCNNGAIIAGKFITQSADVKTLNASTAFINAAKSITAEADNSSSITYYGEPATVNLGTNAYAIKRDNLKLALNN